MQPAATIPGEVHQNREGIGGRGFADRPPSAKYAQQCTLEKIFSLTSVACQQVRGAKQSRRSRSDEVIEIAISRRAVATLRSAHNPLRLRWAGNGCTVGAASLIEINAADRMESPPVTDTGTSERKWYWITVGRLAAEDRC